VPSARRQRAAVRCRPRTRSDRSRRAGCLRAARSKCSQLRAQVFGKFDPSPSHPDALDGVRGIGACNRGDRPGLRAIAGGARVLRDSAGERPPVDTGRSRSPGHGSSGRRRRRRRRRRRSGLRRRRRRARGQKLDAVSRGWEKEEVVAYFRLLDVTEGFWLPPGPSFFLTSTLPPPDPRVLGGVRPDLARYRQNGTDSARR
jgi:hypothetical protein